MQNKINLKRNVAIAMLCAGGTSVFAGGGSLFNEKGNSFDLNAVNDIVSTIEYTTEALKDGKIDENERNVIDAMQSNYDKSYGDGAFNFVFDSIKDFTKTPAGRGLIKEVDYDVAIRTISHMGVKKAAEQQKIMNAKNKTLKNYEYER